MSVCFLAMPTKFCAKFGVDELKMQMKWASKLLVAVNYETAGVLLLDFKSPTAVGDDEVVSVLFTIDELLRMCHVPANGPITLKVSSRTLDSPHVARTVSGCVSVVHQPFDLPKLVLRSERCLVMLPAVENALDLFLSAIHEELSLRFDTCFAVEDESFWVQVAPLLRLNHNYDTQLPGMVCRVYMRAVSPWVLSIVVVPTTVTSIDELGWVAFLFIFLSLCDEPLLAWNLAKRKTPPSERVLDRRFSPSPLSSCHEDVPPTEIPPKEWISSSRCLDVLRENYKPGSLEQIINDVDEKVVTKAIVSTLYAAVQRGANIDHAIVRNVLDEQCECTSLEVDGVAMSLNTFCAHMNADRNGQSQPTYCGESKVQLKFANILRGTFKQVPGMSYFFYTPPHKESDSRFPGKSVLAYFEGLFNDHQPRGLDSTLLERRNSDDHTQEDRVSAPVSLRKSDRLVDQSRPRYALNDIEKPRNGDEKQAKMITQYGRYPLFIYFMCSVEYPNKSMDTFPVTFLPTCVYEVLRESAQKPHEAFDIASVVVRLYLYVVTWPSEKGENVLEDTDTESDDDTHLNKHLRFLEKMPKKEQLVIYELLNRLNRLMELETVLMDSRNVPVTKERIMKISAYIDHECGREKAVGFNKFEIGPGRDALPPLSACHAMSGGDESVKGSDERYAFGVLCFAPSGRLEYLLLLPGKSDGSDGDELLRKDQLYDFWVVLIIDDNIKLQFCQRFEVHPRLRLPRGNCRYPLAIACDALRMSLEQFAIRNIPNTYVVRESEYFKTHLLLAVYGVNRPGMEICEVLRECLQKRLDQVTLSHMIDILAKNSQTRLDSADVLFLQRDSTKPADVFNYSIPSPMSQFLQPMNYYMHQHMQAVMPSARYKEDFGSGSNNSAEQKSVFLPLPYLGKPSESYVPIFYLLVKSPQGGIRSTGDDVIYNCSDAEVFSKPGPQSRFESAIILSGRLCVIHYTTETFVCFSRI
uniref:EF-hand domain-containing protein n=1 Tax=Angiostrongylus cantonensis TaxID=6313 RepID=A0A158P5V7_ANGCA